MPSPAEPLSGGSAGASPSHVPNMLLTITIITQITPDGEKFEISPYIWGVMHGATPRYLEDEEEAICIVEKLGWKSHPKDYAPPTKLVSDGEVEEINRIFRQRGIDPNEIDRIMESGGGTLPGWNGSSKTNSDKQTKT